MEKFPLEAQVPEAHLDIEHHMTAEEKYKEEVLPLLTLLKPKSMSLEEYENQVMPILLEGVQKQHITEGKLSQDPVISMEKAAKLLRSQIDWAIVDYEKLYEDKKDNSATTEFVRQARIAQLYTQDENALKKIQSFHWERYKQYQLDDFYRYLNTAQKTKSKLTEYELDLLASIGYGKDIMCSPMYSVKDYVDIILPDSIITAASTTENDEYYNVKNSLENAPDHYYSKETFEHLITTGFRRTLMENFSKFENADFVDAVMIYPALTNVTEKVQELKRQVKDTTSEDFLSKLDIIVKNTHIGERREIVEFDQYAEIFESQNQLRLPEGDEYSLGVKEKEYIEKGYIGMYTSKKGYIQYLATEHYEWLQNTVEHNKQEHLLLRQPDSQERILRVEDQIKYAKRLIQEKPHMFRVLLNDWEFSKHSLNQEIYDRLSPNEQVSHVTAFNNLNEESFEVYLQSDYHKKDLINDIAAFDLSSSETYKDYHLYGELSKKAAELFGSAHLYTKELGINFPTVKEYGIELFQKELEQKASILDKHFTPKKREEFLYKYKFLLALPAEQLSGLLSELEWLPSISDEKVYVKGLEALKPLPEEEKQKVYLNTVEFRKLFGKGYDAICDRYFSQLSGKESETNLQSCIQDIPTYIEEFHSVDKERQITLTELMPWTEPLLKTLNIQKQTARDEFNPWKKELLPLVNSAVTSNLLSLERQEDGEYVYEFVSRFGMRDMRKLLELFVHIKRSNSIDSMEQSTKETLLTAFNIDADKLCKNDRTNMGLILTELEKVSTKMSQNIMEEQTEFISGIIASDYALEIYSSIKGSSGFGHGKNDREVLETYVEALKKNPEKFKLRTGYVPVELQIPEVVRSNTGSTVESEIEKVLKNSELLTILAAHERILAQSEKDTFDAETIKSEILTSFQKKLEDISVRTTEELTKEIPNEKTIIGLTKRKEMITEHLVKFEEVFEKGNGENLSKLVETVHTYAPNEWEGKKELLMALTLKDMAQRMPEGYAAFSQAFSTLSTEEKLGRLVEFLANHVREHYLNKKHGQDEAIQSDNKDLLKTLKKYWGVQYFEKSILPICHEKIKQLSRGEISQQTRSITFIPSKGIQRIISGDLGKACTTNKNAELAAGKYEGVTSYSMVIDKGTKTERFVGSFLVVETVTELKQPALVLRANNPEQNVFNMVDGEALIRATIESVKELAKRRGIEHVLVPLDGSGGSSSNRPEVSGYYQKHFKNNEKVGLVNTPDTNFNGYEIWDKSKNRAVVKI